MWDVDLDRKTYEAWVRALYSGTYAQNFKGKLCIMDDAGLEWEYCPLGVLADVMKLYTHEEQTVLGLCQVVFDSTKNVYLSGHLPYEILPHELQAEIMDLCDSPPRGSGKSLAVIASWIEGNVRPREAATA